MRYTNSDGVKKFLTKYSLDFSSEYDETTLENYIEIADFVFDWDDIKGQIAELYQEVVK